MARSMAAEGPAKKCWLPACRSRNAALDRSVAQGPGAGEQVGLAGDVGAALVDVPARLAQQVGGDR